MFIFPSARVRLDPCIFIGLGRLAFSHQAKFSIYVYKRCLPWTDISKLFIKPRRVNSRSIIRYTATLLLLFFILSVHKNVFSLNIYYLLKAQWNFRVNNADTTVDRKARTIYNQNLLWSCPDYKFSRAVLGQTMRFAEPAKQFFNLLHFYNSVKKKKKYKRMWDIWKVRKLYKI